LISFKEILSPGCAAVGVPAKSKAEALAAAVRALLPGGLVRDEEKLLSEVKAREALASTGIGEGVAVPHALCEALGETAMSVIRLEKPIEFESVDGEPVDLVFLMAGPRGDTGVHLRLLSKLARLLHDPAFRAEARRATDGAALAELLYTRD